MAVSDQDRSDGGESHSRRSLPENLREQLRSLAAVSSNRYLTPVVVGENAGFWSLHAIESAKTRKRPVLLTITKSGSAGELKGLADVREALANANDPRIGLEYASFYGESRGTPWACLVSSYHEGAVRLLTYVHESVTTGEDVLKLLTGMAEQVHSLHTGGYSHGDVSASNFVVSAADGVPHLIDLELCQPLVREDSDGRLLIGGTPGFVHPDAMLFAADPEKLDLVTPELRIRWDLFGLGKTFITVLNGLKPAVDKDLGAYQQRALLLIACRALDGRNKAGEGALGLSAADFEELKYVAVGQLLRDLEKARHPSSLLTEVPELDLSGSDRVQVTPFAPVVRTDRLHDILTTDVFQNLSQIKQLGLIELVYPTANHTRSEHALGTYALVCEYIRWLLRDDVNPLFAQLMTAEDLKAVILAALLHDIGHYALAHDFEEADREIYDHEARTIRLLRDSPDWCTSLRAVNRVVGVYLSVG